MWCAGGVMDCGSELETVELNSNYIHLGDWVIKKRDMRSRVMLSIPRHGLWKTYAQQRNFICLEVELMEITNTVSEWKFWFTLVNISLTNIEILIRKKIGNKLSRELKKNSNCIFVKCFVLLYIFLFILFFFLRFIIKKIISFVLASLWV